MNILNPISDIMTKDLVTLSPSASIADAAKLFNDNKIHHIPICEGKKMVGIVSKSDYLFFRRGFLDTKQDENIEEIRMNNYQVSYIMTTGIAKLLPESRIDVALELFKENIFHAIPIVNNNEELVGIVTTYDIINQISKERVGIV
jgi:acetoin utilization protein AcuB